MPTMTDEQDSAVPKDYRLLVPREWFRVDLTQERWRPQLTTFVDRHTAGRSVPAQVRQEIWAALRNTAEAGLAHGALEFYLLAESEDGGSMPASLLVSLLPTRGGLAMSPEDFARALAEKAAKKRGNATAVSVVELPAGTAVRVVGVTTLDLHVHMPGGVGYLVLSFSVPVNGVAGPMGRLGDAIGRSLRWIV
jgi:hypothetical protein